MSNNLLRWPRIMQPKMIDVTPEPLAPRDPAEETLDDIAEEYRHAMAGEKQAEALLEYRRQERIDAQEKWRKAKQERGLE